MSPLLRPGLRANWRQFLLLMLVNAFVGAMVGLERTVVPLLAEASFDIVSKRVTLSFILSFGVVKALANLLTGTLADRIGRKPLLIAGWLAALPVPFLIILAPSWEWVIAANLLLGLNQGLAWSATVIMKIDLVGPRQRGLAMGLNEAAGYLALSLSSLAGGYVAATYALRPHPFYLGIAFAVAGLLLSLIWVRETHDYARAAPDPQGAAPLSPQEAPSFREIFLRTSWTDRSLFAASQAGLVNNLNDGMIWGLLPLYLTSRALPLDQVAMVVALYPASWGIAQLGTGALSDRVGRKGPIVAGLGLQALGILLVLLVDQLLGWLTAALLMGFGTALVYPTLLAAIGDLSHPSWRASAVGVYRLWRDSGYAVGALLSGVIADRLGMEWGIGLVALLTALSACLVIRVMRETMQPLSHPRSALPGAAEEPSRPPVSEPGG